MEALPPITHRAGVVVAISALAIIECRAVGPIGNEQLARVKESIDRILLDTEGVLDLLVDVRRAESAQSMFPRGWVGWFGSKADRFRRCAIVSMREPSIELKQMLKVLLRGMRIEYFTARTSAFAFLHESDKAAVIRGPQ